MVDEFAEVCRRYRVVRVYGDRYAGEWPREQFAKRSINYIHATSSKSEIYIDALPLINSGAADLLDDEVLISQLASLERRVTRGGRDSIDHPPGGHDDVANAATGALVAAMQRHVRDRGNRAGPLSIENLSNYSAHDFARQGGA
ncbi:MAG TPA: hypothetical protein VMW68_08105 [Methyloceanibacter sp.]|nr:hypothetical protein [Methyloceanibacter sp.]